MTFKATWLGHAAFSLDMDGVHVLVDPFLSNNPKAPVTADEVKADFIVLTHGHGDHVGDTVSIAKRTGATVISNFEIARWCQAQGIENTFGLNTGGGSAFDFGRVEFTIAFHSSTLPDGSYGGSPNGLIFTGKDGKKFYHAGDTALFGDMKLYGDKGIDAAALPVGDYYTMSVADSIRAVEFIRPKAVIPMHHGTFPVIEVDVKAWAKAVEAQTGAKPVVLQPGETYEV